MNRYEPAIVWLHHIWGEWHKEGSSEHYLDSSQASRAYDHWAFAENLLTTSGFDPMARGAVMQKLWNAVDSRLRMLHDAYNFRVLARSAGWTSKQDRQTLGILERIGLARPAIILRLKEIRNAVEHEDATPPHRAACMEFLDYTWYFLRSTDPFVVRALEDVDLVLLDSDHANHPSKFGTYGVSLKYDLATWSITLSAWLHPEEISEIAVATWIPIRLTEPPSRRSRQVMHIRGQVVPDSLKQTNLIREYFSFDWFTIHREQPD